MYDELMKILIVFFILSRSILASQLNIGVSQTNSGPVRTEDIANILKCATESKKHKFSFITLPNLRGLNYVKKNKVDAYYPVYVNAVNIDYSLLPIYIDEVLLLSNKLINFDVETPVGVIRGEHSPIFKDFKNLKPTFLVTNPDSLLKGLDNNRVDSILLYRSQLPADLDLKNYHIQTILYHDVGIQINTSFENKVNKVRSDLQKKFIRCILNYDFKLSKLRKRAIELAITSDIKSLQKKFLIKRRRVSNLNKKELEWANKDKKLIQSILNNSIASLLKESVVKYPFINEAFVYNHQGALISSLKMTSDFDQSDEEKYIILKNFKEFTIRNITNIYFDESSNSFQVGLSIRLNDESGNFNGGLYIGADINKLITFYKLN